MFRNKKKIPAFTIIELLVVIMASSILFAATFSAYRYVHFLFISYGQDKTRQENFKTFYNLMYKDFADGSSVTLEENSLTLYKNANVVFYEFVGNGIIRKQEGVDDTLHIHIHSLDAYMGDKKIDKGLLDKLIVSVSYFNEEHDLVFKKDYGVIQKFHRDEDQGLKEEEIWEE